MDGDITQTPKILVVEDEYIVALDLKEQIKKLGYSIAGIATTAEQAVELASVTTPDLILMDINLESSSDGVTAAEEIRSISSIPIIYLTAFADSGTIERATKTEPLGYIVKPYRERELETALRLALYKSSMEQQLREHARQLVLILQHAIDGIILLDEDFRILQINPAATALLSPLGHDPTDMYLSSIGDAPIDEVVGKAHLGRWFILEDPPVQPAIKLFLKEMDDPHKGKVRLMILRDGSG